VLSTSLGMTQAPVWMDADIARLLERLVSFAGLIVFGIVLYAVGRLVIKRIAVPKHPLTASLSARAATTRSLLLSVWKYVVLVLVLAGALSIVGPRANGAIAVTGVVGLIAAFSAQTLLKDVFAGLSILLEGQFGVGDRVRLFGPDIEGTVEGIGLRITVVREEDGNRVFVPNGSITAVRTFTGGESRTRSRGERGGRGRTPRQGDRPRSRSERTPRQRAEGAVAAGAAAGDGSDDASESDLDRGDGSDEAGSAARRRSRRGGRRRRPASERDGADGGSSGDAPAPAGETGRTEAGPGPDAAARPDPAPEAPARPDPAPAPEPTRPAPAGPEPRSDELRESPWSIE